MSKYAVIENNKVVNICIAEPSDIKPDNWVLCEEGGIDWDYINGQFVDNRPVSEPITQSAPTKEQLLAQLAELSAKINALGA
jgi:hypothetical protein